MMEAYGATATMECWLPEELENLSFSHIWSSSPSFTVPWLFFGVTPTSPGYTTFQVKPQPGPVVKGSARLPTIKGEITVGFEQGGEAPGTQDSTLSLTITVPGGTTARALLPLWGCTTGMAVTLDGKVVTWVAQGDYAAVDGIPAGEHFLASSLCPKATA
jgi:alpha-L-rhamnosidase